MSAEEKMSAVAESAWAKFAARIVTPLLLLLVSLLLTSLLNTVQHVGSEQAAQAKDLATLSRDFSTLNTKVDWALVQRISTLEERVRSLERKVNP